jgi:hypothetical protein
MTVADADIERAARLEERQRRLADRVSALRAHASTGTRDRVLLILGGTLIVVGVLAVVLGWLGASDTPVVFEQIPFLISGGLLGLALVFVGTFTYFAYWLTAIVRENRALRMQLLAERQELTTEQQQIAETLTEIRELLARAAKT